MFDWKLSSERLIFMDIYLKKYKVSNSDFAKQLFFEIKSEELNFTPPFEKSIINLLNFQFNAYKNNLENYTNLSNYLIYSNNNLVGRLIFVVEQANLHIVELSILKKFRRNNIGKKTLQYIQKKYEKVGSFSLYVRKNNPFIEFYKKLEFEIISEDEINYFMKLKKSSYKKEL